MGRQHERGTRESPDAIVAALMGQLTLSDREDTAHLQWADEVLELPCSSMIPYRLRSSRDRQRPRPSGSRAAIVGAVHHDVPDRSNARRPVGAGMKRDTGSFGALELRVSID